LITVNFDVTVGITEGAMEDIFGVPVRTGDVLRGNFTINSLAGDANPRPDFGFYRGTGQSLHIDLGTGLTLPVDSYQVSDNALCLPALVVCDALQTLASSRTFPEFASIHVSATLFAPATSRQGDRLPQSAAELAAAYASGDFVLQALLPDRPQPFTHWLPGTLRVRDVSSQPIPEPGTLVLIGTGAAGLIASRRRRRARMSTTALSR
jgi:hypothetical protein